MPNSQNRVGKMQKHLYIYFKKPVNIYICISNSIAENIFEVSSEL